MSMSDFWIFFQTGLWHVIDFSGYDHILFLIALTVPYNFKDWKILLLLVSVFTLGHTSALLLAVLELLKVSASLVELLIPITILLTALYTLFNTGKKPQKSHVAVLSITGCFGLIHGLGFAGYFKSILPGAPSDKLLPLLEFAAGIEAAQIIIVLGVLILAYLFQSMLRFSQRDWILVMSAFVAGVVTPLIIENPIWK